MSLLNKTQFENSLDFAKQCDNEDELKAFRQRFHFPKREDGSEKVYLCGNSLGLKPTNTKDYINQVLSDWETYGVEGHTEAKMPWMPYHEFLADSMARIVGAKPSEVVIMNTLSVNLHLMMVSFYNPTPSKYKIVVEADAFPSDIYAVESQIKFHNFNPKKGLLLWQPRSDGKYYNEDFKDLIEQHKDEIALVMIGNTNYYTGQFFDMEFITRLCQTHGITIGFDLAHGVGNIKPNLHALGIDFAVWCTYKYLNSGPGSLGG